MKTNEPARCPWIDVKERLPELPNSYDGENFFSNILLITIKLKDRPAFTGVGRCYKYRREEHVVWSDEIHIWPSEEFSVTHWMPLPEPPEKVK